jgi:hypothetical protein
LINQAGLVCVNLLPATQLNFYMDVNLMKIRYSILSYIPFLLASALITSCGNDNKTTEYTVTATAGMGGTITPQTFTLTEGDAATFTAQADSGYVIETVSGCDGVLVTGIYTTGAITADCTVSANFTALATSVTVEGLVLDASGRSLAGVEAFNDGGVLATSDSSGAMSFTLASTDLMSVRLRKANYTNQTVIVDVLNAKAVFTSIMSVRNLPVIVSADTSFNISGQYGASVEVSGGTLVDRQGNAVSGDIELNITPVNVADNDQLKVFPGAYAGVDPQGTTVPIIMPYGTVEYYLSQNGEELNLAAGASATIEIPIFVTEHQDGTAIQVGQQGGLVWYLDEVSGQWQEVTTGTIVASNDSPTGMALRATITHFSWWNYDSSIGASNDPEDPSLETYSCRIPLILNNQPADIEPTGILGYFITANTSSPRYGRTSYLSNGALLRFPRDMDIAVNAEAIGENFYTASTVFNCNDASVTLNFSDPLAPVIQEFEASVKPVFELSGSNLYEVVSNIATLSWIAVGQDALNLIETELPLNIPLLVARGSVDVPLQYQAPPIMGMDTLTITFTLSAQNEVAQEQVQKNIDYLFESTPLVSRFAFFYVIGPAVQINWEVEGADQINIGYVINGNPVESLTYINSSIPDQMFNLPFNQVPNGGFGYQIVVEYKNQYGSSYQTFSRGDCPPNTDLC